MNREESLAIGELLAASVRCSQDERVEDSRRDGRISRGNKVFLVILGIFVLLLCFTYGLSVGARSSLAHASKREGTVQPEVHLGAWQAADFESMGEDDLHLVPGVTANSMGAGLKINGRDSSMWSIGSSLSTKDLLIEQERIWRGLGYLTQGLVTGKRGVLIASRGHGSAQSGERMMLTVWKTLPVVQDRLGLRVQGVLSTMSAMPSGSAGSNRLPHGFAPMPGGKGGAVVEAIDERDAQGLGVKTFSATFSNPGSVRQNMQFYIDALTAEEWELSDSESSGAAPAGVRGTTMFLRRGQQEALLVFSPIRKSSMLESGSGTQVFVTLFNVDETA